MKRRRFIGNSLGFGLILIAGSGRITAAAKQLARRPDDNPLTDGRWRLDMLGRLNAIRDENKLLAFRMDDRLNKAAQLHSDDMANRDYFEHQTPEGSRMTDRADAFGYHWRLLFENIAVGQTSTAEVINGWMNSAEHRAAILDRAGRDTGMGHSYRAIDGGAIAMHHYWTLLIGAE